MRTGKCPSPWRRTTCAQSLPRPDAANFDARTEPDDAVRTSDLSRQVWAQPLLSHPLTPSGLAAPRHLPLRHVMRIDPVYLVAPEAERSPLASRRAFLITGGGFLAGAALGSTLGYAGGSRVHAAANEQSDGSRSSLDDDALLAELRDLARHGSIDRLIRSRRTLLHFARSRYRDDPVILHGVARLAQTCLASPRFPDRKASAMSIANVIDASLKANGSLKTFSLRLKEVR